MEKRMKMKRKRAISALVLLTVFVLPLVGSGCHKAPDALIPEEPEASSIPWWDAFPTFTAYTAGLDEIQYVNATATTVTAGLSDEGRGPVFKESEYYVNKSVIDALSSGGIVLATWLEGQGTTEAYLGALHEISPGSYEMTDAGIPRVAAHQWSWDLSGPSVNPLANKPVWFSVAAFVNKLDWQGKFLNTMTLSEPKYPDGRSALGWFNDDDSLPRNAKLYDALCGKTINGQLPMLADGASKSHLWMPQVEVADLGNLPVSPDGQSLELNKVYAGHFSFYKDMASDWWIEYNVMTAKDSMEKGVRFFWVDNYNGYDFLSCQPIYGGFGEWSVEGFKTYLKDHPAIGVSDPDNFNIRTYLLGKFQEHFGRDGSNIYDRTISGMWSSTIWQEDPIWQAYASYKHECSKRMQTALYKGIKNAAKELGIDPNEVCIAGNDIPRYTLGSLSGEDMDMIAFEYNPTYTLHSGTYADGLPNVGSAGTIYKLATSLAKSRHTQVWYYLEGANTAYRGKYQLGVTAGYEMLLSNALNNAGEANTALVGNNDSLHKTNGTIRKLADTFGERVSVGDVGLLYSADSVSQGVTPGGTGYGGQIPTSQDFYGWGQMLEKAHIPYTVVHDTKLDEQLKDKKLLIVPSVISISESNIAKIEKFVSDGGNVIYTNTSSGIYDSRDNAMLRRSEPLLYNRLKALEGTGRVLYMDNTVSVNYYKMHTNAEYSQKGYEQLLNAVTSFYEKGLDRQLDVSGLGEHIQSGFLYDAKNNALFIDLLNTDADFDADTITANNGGNILFRPVGNRADGSTFRATVYSEDGVGTEIGLTALEDGSCSLTVPAFENYVSVKIESVEPVETAPAENPGFWESFKRWFFGK